MSVYHSARRLATETLLQIKSSPEESMRRIVLDLIVLASDYRTP